MLPGICIFIIPSCDVSTAKLTDIKLCASPDSGGECEGDISSFSTKVQIIYCTAKLKNAPLGTKAAFEWKRGDKSMGKVDVETSSGVASSNFRPTYVMEPGRYSVTVKIVVDNSKPVTKEFTIE